MRIKLLFFMFQRRPFRPTPTSVHEVHLCFRAHRSDSCPPQFPPELYCWRLRSQPVQTGQRRGSWSTFLLWLRRTPSPESTERAWRALPLARSSCAPSLNPSLQGRAWGPPWAAVLEGRGEVYSRTRKHQEWENKQFSWNTVTRHWWKTHLFDKHLICEERNGLRLTCSLPSHIKRNMSIYSHQREPKVKHGMFYDCTSQHIYTDGTIQQQERLKQKMQLRFANGFYYNPLGLFSI